MSDIAITTLANPRLKLLSGTKLLEKQENLTATLGYFELQNRRFLGNKYKLLSFINEIIESEVGDYKVFCDLFAGTGTVGSYFNAYGKSIISNDILFSSYVSLKTFLETSELDISELVKKIEYLNSLKSNHNYFREHFGGTFFTDDNAGLIGRIRETIEDISDSEQEKYALISALIYAVDKVANTVGHYDAYRKNMTSFNRLCLRVPNIKLNMNSGNKVYRSDANELVRTIKSDVLYIDPPYNSRQYSDAYHLLENLAEWNKPSVTGVAKKMDRSKIKSKYSLKSATQAMKDLIENANTKHILVSYNSTGESKHSRSNARISDSEMIEILKAKGQVKIFEKEYRAFTTGKSSSGGNSERIFYCKVKR